MKYTILLIALLLCFEACRPVLNTVSGLNKAKSFHSLDDYFDNVVPKYALDIRNIYYPACADETTLYHSIVNNKIAYFYGVFIDSTKRLGYSDFFMSGPACSGRVEDEIDYPENYTVQDSLFLKAKIINAVSKKRFIPHHKRNIVLVFSEKQGAFSKKKLRTLQHKYSDTSQYRILLISLDHICELK